MTNILQYTTETYAKHLELILFTGISFIIALLIPIFASFPTYSDMGAIFIRTASIYLNLTPVSAGIIIISTLFSLIFLSFAIVAINVIVKHSRTHTRIRREVIEGLERYTSRVFAVLLLFTALVVLFNIATYFQPHSKAATALFGLIISPLFLYAPASIVIDDKKIFRAIKASIIFSIKRFDYLLLWVLLSIVLLSVVDLFGIAIPGVLSTYIVLFIDSIVVLPFMVLLQSEMYIKRFALLKR